MLTFIISTGLLMQCTELLANPIKWVGVFVIQFTNDFRLTVISPISDHGNILALKFIEMITWLVTVYPHTK